MRKSPDSQITERELDIDDNVRTAPSYSGTPRPPRYHLKRAWRTLRLASSKAARELWRGTGRSFAELALAAKSAQDSLRHLRS